MRRSKYLTEKCLHVAVFTQVVIAVKCVMTQERMLKEPTAVTSNLIKFFFIFQDFFTSKNSLDRDFKN